MDLLDEKQIIIITDEMIDEENKEDIKKLVQKTRILNETMKDLNSLLKDSGEVLLKTREITDETEEIIKDTNVELAIANKYQKSGNLLKSTLIGGIIGLLLGGPLGGLAGWSISATISGITALTGSILGSVTFGGTVYGLVKNKRDVASKDCKKIIEDRKKVKL
jgi:hypothetical protein